MTYITWSTFVLASLLIIAAPGPAVTLLITTSISKGKYAALYMIPGFFLGDLTAMVCSFAGVGALLMASPMLFGIVKLIGAGYLIYQGAHIWIVSCKSQSKRENKEKTQSALKAFWVTVLNPKSFLFFVAFMPQFISESQAFLPQLIILGATFLGLALLNDIAYTLLAGKAAKFLNKYSEKILYRIGAVNLMITGIAVIGLK